jgi:hypothetical protein
MTRSNFQRGEAMTDDLPKKEWWLRQRSKGKKYELVDPHGSVVALIDLSGGMNPFQIFAALNLTTEAQRKAYHAQRFSKRIP